MDVAPVVEAVGVFIRQRRTTEKSERVKEGSSLVCCLTMQSVGFFLPGLYVMKGIFPEGKQKKKPFMLTNI